MMGGESSMLGVVCLSRHLPPAGVCIGGEQGKAIRAPPRRRGLVGY